MKSIKKKGVVITCHDPVHCRIPKERVALLRQAVEYPDTNWRQGQFAMKKQKRMASFIDGRGGLFLSGLLPRIRQFARAKNVSVSLKGTFEKIKPTRDPELTGINLRGYQAQAITIAFKKQRGLIIAPTGTGKTVTMGGIISCVPDAKVLVLMHTKDLQMQTYKQFEKFGFPSVQVVGGVSGPTFTILNQGTIIIALIQTYSKLNLKKMSTVFDVIIVDEAHHVNALKSQYGKVLSMCLAPIRIGFTATIPKDKKKLYAMEGLLGPKIYELPDDEAQEMGVLATPTIRLINVPYSVDLADANRRYKQLHKHALVENKRRNRLIMRQAVRAKKDGLKILIMVKELKHLHTLHKMAIDLFKVKSRYIKTVHGKVAANVRELTKEYLNDGTYSIVISTVVWKEGVDIPNLDMVILADIGKAHGAILQALGRGRRVTATKTKLIVVDFLDPYKFLCEHAIKRLQIYVEKGWL